MTDTVDIQFIALGGGSSIGASCYLVRVAATTVLIDCGIDPTRDPTETFSSLVQRAESSGLVSSLADISAFVLTHAHVDHSGLVPALHRYVRNNLRRRRMPPFHTSKATKELLADVWPDVLQFCSNPPFQKHNWQNAQGDLTYEPSNLLDWLNPSLGSIRLHPNTHLLGASLVELQISGRCILLTGDMRLTASPTLVAQPAPDCRPDVMVIDGTYAAAGARSIAGCSQAQQMLFTLLDECMERKSTILLPCFAIGRAQDVLGMVLEYCQQRTADSLDIYIDGQARIMTDRMLTEFGSLLRPEYIELYRRNQWRIHEVSSETPLEDLYDTMSGVPSVVIASSGMLLAGSASWRWLKLLAGKPNTSVVTTGYLSEYSMNELRAARQWHSVGPPNSVAQLPISGHSSADEMFDLVDALRPKEVVIVHCSGANREEDMCGQGSLLQRLRGAGYRANIAVDDVTLAW